MAYCDSKAKGFVTYENWDARTSPAWVACPTCGERVEMPLEPPLPETPNERQILVQRIIVPFARKLQNQCQYAERMRHV